MNEGLSRTKKLLNNLMERSMTDRSEEWFRHYMFADMGNADGAIIERRALAFAEMLKAMVSTDNSEKTHTYEIKEGELIVGIIPMGSVGLGKVFPNYLTEDEKRLLSVTNRDMQSTFGHNIPDHRRVLEGGLQSIVEYCENAPVEDEDKKAFYHAVIICCNAVKEYAESFAKLAEEQAQGETNEIRKAELLEISRICRKVPWEKAETFYEAIQSIYFIHLALHSTLDYVSLGRLDQTLEPYLQKDLESGMISEEKAIELYECLFIKCAERINLNIEYFEKMDHASFGGVFGVSSVFLDQIASANNFLQNITIGGLTRDGKDACNLSTKLILRACSNMGLPSPIVNLRIHSQTPKEIVQEAVKALRKGKNGMPIIMNDEMIVKGLVATGLPIEECNDYGADGCWEPILNAKCDWVFGMVNFLTILEVALNGGCTFSTDPSLLKGNKISYKTHTADRIQSFDEFIDILKVHIQFYMDKTALTAYTYYSVEGSVTPTPFFSALLGGCLERGKDKTWGGAEYHLVGSLGVGLPNCANALANIKQYVFEEKIYTLEEVVTALKNNYEGYEDMQKLFSSSAYKFGNNNEKADEMMRLLMDCYYECAQKSKKLADETFMTQYSGCEKKMMQSNRAICGYEGLPMKEKFGEDFNITFNIGCGTFGQYSLMGKSVGASADGRKRGEPLAQNFTPSLGTIHNGLGNVLKSVERLGLDRFSAGAIIDFCIDDTAREQEDVYYENMLETFIADNGNMISISFVEGERIKEAFDICEQVRKKQCESSLLKQYADISVRVGGFNAPFITLPREQQICYIEKMFTAKA